MDKYERMNRERQELFWYKAKLHTRKGSKASRAEQYRILVRLDAFSKAFKLGMDITTISKACVLAFYQSIGQSQASQTRAYYAVCHVWRLLGRDQGGKKKPPKPRVLRETGGKPQ